MFDPSPLTFQALSVIHWLCQQNPSLGHQVPEAVCPPEYQANVHAELARFSLVTSDTPAGGLPDFGIEPRSRMDAMSAASRYRQCAIQRHILEQLATAASAGAIVYTILELQDAVPLQGDPPTDVEMSEAERALHDNGLITGIGSFGEGLSRPEITTQGQTVVRSPYAPEDWLIAREHRPSTTSIHHGDINTLTHAGAGPASLVSQSGRHNTADVYQSAQWDRADFSQALDQIEAALAAEPSANADRANAQLDLIRQMHDEEQDPGVLRRMVAGLSNGLGQALGQRAPELIQMALTTLPAT